MASNVDFERTYADIFSPVFSALRVYALTQKNKLLSAVVLVLGLGPFVVNMVRAIL